MLLVLEKSFSPAKELLTEDVETLATVSSHLGYTASAAPSKPLLLRPYFGWRPPQGYALQDIATLTRYGHH